MGYFKIFFIFSILNGVTFLSVVNSKLKTMRNSKIKLFTIVFNRFKGCNSVHHHTIQINQTTRCNNFFSLLLDFFYSSTCYGRLHAHHQELNNCSSSFWFYLRSVVIAVLLVVVGPAGPTTTNSNRSQLRERNLLGQP
jgi:hypothetical protein